MTVHKLTALPGNLTGLSKTSCIWQFSEWYLASGKSYRVKKIDHNKIVTLQSDPKKLNSFLTLLKKISYLTVLLLIAAIIIRKSHRKKHYIVVKANQRPVPRPLPPQQPKVDSVKDALSQMREESLLISKFTLPFGSFSARCQKLEVAIEMEGKRNPYLSTSQYVLKVIQEALETYEKAYIACQEFDTLDQRLLLGIRTSEHDQLKAQVQVLKSLLLKVYPEEPPSYLDSQSSTHKKLLKAWSTTTADVAN